MNLRKAAKKLRREATAHPAKMAVLALLCLVALWFSVPLMWGWIDKDESPKVLATEEPTAESSPSIEAAVASAAPESQPKQTWRQIVGWMQRDSRTLATNPILGRRDPFLVEEHKVEVAKVEDQPKEVGPQELTPEDLGLKLSSTIIGTNRRVAQINGRSYHEGETIKLAEEGRDIEFALVAVYSRYVLLQRNEEQYELAIPSPAESGWIEFTRNKD